MKGLSYQAWLHSASNTRADIFCSLSVHNLFFSSSHTFSGIFSLQYTKTCKQTHGLKTVAAVENIHSLIRSCPIIFCQRRKFFLQQNSQKMGFGASIIGFLRQLPCSSSVCYQVSQFCHAILLDQHSLLHFSQNKMHHQRMFKQL